MSLHSLESSGDGRWWPWHRLEHTPDLSEAGHTHRGGAAVFPAEHN